MSVHTLYGTVRRTAAAGVAALCLVFGLPAVAHADDTPAPTLTGTLRTPDGQPIANALITVSVEPPSNALADLPEGSEVHPTDVGWAYSWEDGRFDTWIADPATLIAARDEDGLIALVLSAPTEQGQIFYRSRVVLGDDGVVRPYAEDVAADADPEERQSSMSAMLVSTNGRPAFDLVSMQVGPNETRQTPVVENGSSCPTGLICATGAALDTTDPARTDRPVYSEATVAENTLYAAPGKKWDPDIWCGGHHWYLKKSRDKIGRNVALSNQYTGANTTGTFEYKTSKNTAVEVGVTNRSNTLVGTLGMEKGKTTTAQINSEIPRNTKAEWWVSFGFNLYDLMCQNRTTGVKWWSGYTQTRPKGFTGNFSRRLWTPFTCQNKYRNIIGGKSKILVAEDKTSTRTGAFALGSSVGNLKATQKWTSTVSVGYQAVNANGFNICGYKGRWQSGVAKTREVA